MAGTYCAAHFDELLDSNWENGHPRGYKTYKSQFCRFRRPNVEPFSKFSLTSQLSSLNLSRFNSVGLLCDPMYDCMLLYGP
jgi:hypothetical protein